MCTEYVVALTGSAISGLDPIFYCAGERCRRYKAPYIRHASNARFFLGMTRRLLTKRTLSGGGGFIAAHAPPYVHNPGCYIRFYGLDLEKM